MPNKCDVVVNIINMLTVVVSVPPKGRSCRCVDVGRSADDGSTAVAAGAAGVPSTGSRDGVDGPRAAPNSRPGVARRTSRPGHQRPLCRPNGRRRRPRASRFSCPTVSPRPCNSHARTTRVSRRRRRTVCSSGLRWPVRIASVRTEWWSRARRPGNRTRRGRPAVCLQWPQWLAPRTTIVTRPSLGPLSSRTMMMCVPLRRRSSTQWTLADNGPQRWHCSCSCSCRVRDDIDTASAAKRFYIIYNVVCCIITVVGLLLQLGLSSHSHEAADVQVSVTVGRRDLHRSIIIM